MKITLLVIGKTSTSYLRDGIDNYTRRIGYYVPFDLKILPDIKNTKSLTEERQKVLEGEAFMSIMRPGDYVVLLDERGREMTSRQFSDFISEKMTRLPGQLFFVIGGPYGFSEDMYRRANDKLSLSRMTFSHEMVRLFFVEQIYRAMTILRGEPYHHD